MEKALLSSKKHDWGTPEPIRGMVHTLSGQKGVCDPCPGESPVGAVFKSADGLAIEWDAPGKLVYVNPPYGRALPTWVQKCMVQGTKCEIVLLVPSRTDTRWFHDALQSAKCCCLLRGRLKFQGAKFPAPFPTAVFYWGNDVDSFKWVFGQAGYII